MNNYQSHPLAGASDLDSAMTKLWDFYKQYFVGLYIISFILSLISAVFSASLDLAAIQTTTDPEELLAMMKDMILPYSLIMLVSLIFGVFMHAWILEKPLTGENAVANTLRKGFQAFIPYLIVVIVMGIAGSVMVAVGLVLLVLPGLFAVFYVLTIAIFALPVTLAESRNAATVISRSVSLAHRNLWPNMGWVIVVLLIIIIISLVLSSLVMLPFTGSLIKSLTNPEEAFALLEMVKNPVYIIISSLTTALITPVLPILAFILYFRNNVGQSVTEVAKEDDDRVRVEDLYPKMPEKE
ncbi:MAG: hypothetical protein MUC78_00985 [Bacteroidales bacterium]|jgi:hypothetical protein|nr:hypothetical protein [Bacteroidales bacterium]